jgi:hypothetical protein
VRHRGAVDLDENVTGQVGLEIEILRRRQILCGHCRVRWNTVAHITEALLELRRVERQPDSIGVTRRREITVDGVAIASNVALARRKRGRDPFRTNGRARKQRRSGSGTRLCCC